MDDRKFEHLVKEHRDMVYSVALAHTKDPSAADDVAQETFIKAYRSWDGLKNPSRVKTWLYAIARNTAIDWFRRQKRAPNSGLDELDVAAPEKEKDRVTMEELVAGLRPDYQEILRMRYVEELSYSEIGKRLGMTSTAVGEKLWRIREYMRNRHRRAEVSQ